MKVIQYLKQNGLDKLCEEFSIKAKVYDEGLIVLNYDQIESTKTDPIVMECRGLILDTDFNVVSRSFDRFFNYGEGGVPEFNIGDCYVMDKVDGSLIKIYYWNGKWHISTRGTAFGESTVNGFEVTFAELVKKALNCSTEQEFQNWANDHIWKNETLIAELTCLENRVVKRHPEGYHLWYLGERTNEGYYTTHLLNIPDVMKKPNIYTFDSLENCIKAASELKDLDEGYVVYDGKTRIPLCKIKSPAYVAVHHIRGEGLNPKRIMELVCMNEVDEYLAYFPEDAAHFELYLYRHEQMTHDMAFEYIKVVEIESQKDFALAIQNLPYKSVLFTARKLDKSPLDVYNSLEITQRVKLLTAFMESYN